FAFGHVLGRDLEATVAHLERVGHERLRGRGLYLPVDDAGMLAGLLDDPAGVEAGDEHAVALDARAGERSRLVLAGVMDGPDGSPQLVAEPSHEPQMVNRT